MGDNSIFIVFSNIWSCVRLKKPSIPSFLATQIVYIGYGQFKKNDSFSFYLFIAVLLFLLYLIAANKSMLLLYACAHNISLKYLFPEKNCHVVKSGRSVAHFV
jgi:hypothetical protein